MCKIKPSVMLADVSVSSSYAHLKQWDKSKAVCKVT